MSTDTSALGVPLAGGSGGASSFPSSSVQAGGTSNALSDPDKENILESIDAAIQSFQALLRDQQREKRNEYAQANSKMVLHVLQEVKDDVNAAEPIDFSTSIEESWRASPLGKYQKHERPSVKDWQERIREDISKASGREAPFEAIVVSALFTIGSYVDQTQSHWSQPPPQKDDHYAQSSVADRAWDFVAIQSARNPQYHKKMDEMHKSYVEEGRQQLSGGVSQSDSPPSRKTPWYMRGSSWFQGSSKGSKSAMRSE
ncbi:hypothetical protein I302_103059 [Kwoniella bestiolae CBS 10118]|uniref:Uncharacterized protein n=1 Tax=Kwoniella bestiolae CBS 10118 TaxID=1296100 RepID=A0A1B9GGW8_9TREE|nr:hypothetical protein I302_01757 [Kwoniella bestiolae CBS 10118]OCF30238.1 hypothetical protein I302_01757 [Kwoniella bestiolae CBS 10118]